MGEFPYISIFLSISASFSLNIPSPIKIIDSVRECLLSSMLLIPIIVNAYIWILMNIYI